MPYRLEKLNVLIADDHDLLRQALKLHVEMLAENVGVSEARSYDDVLSFLTGVSAANPAGRFRLIVLDLRMPGTSNDDLLDGLRRVLAAAGTTPIVIFSATEDPMTIRSVLKMGVKGYIPKTTSGRSLVSALGLVLDGKSYVPSAIMNEINALQDPKPVPDGMDGALTHLTPREFYALKALTMGLTNKEIAREMGLQDVTVKMHLRNAYRKIGATNRIDAVRISLALGIDNQTQISAAR